MKKTNYPLRTLVFRTFASLTALSLVILTLCISANFSRTITKMTYDKYESVFQQSSQQLSGIFYNIATLSAVLDNSTELISAVNLSLHASGQHTRLQNEARVQNLLTTASYNSSYVKNIYLYKEGKVFCMQGSNLSLPPSLVEEQPWFSVMCKKGAAPMVVPYDKNNYIFICPFQATLHEASPGLMMIFLDSGLLKHCLENIGNEKGTLIYAYDEAQTLLYTNEEESHPLPREHMNLLKTSNSGEKIRLGGDSYFMTKETNAFSNWTLVALVPTGIIFQKLVPLYLQVLPLVLLILGLSVYLSFLLSGHITKPLRPLLQSMKQSSQGDFDFQPYQTQIEEINTLVYGYDDMLHRISELIQQIQQAEKDKRKTELEILQAQISPHFIYNTLNAIRWLALMQDAPKIAEVISSFSTLLQLTNSHPNEFISVDEELQEVSCYLDIMKFRYNANLEVVWEVEEQTRQYRTLKLIIQPLVENCFAHAFSSSDIHGKITIRSFQKEQSLVFEVSDDGAGFVCDPNALPASTTEGHHNIGLTNIQNRLKLWFGESYGLTITSLPGQGTTVSLTQPVSIKEKEDSHDTHNDC